MIRRLREGLQEVYDYVSGDKSKGRISTIPVAEPVREGKKKLKIAERVGRVIILPVGFGDTKYTRIGEYEDFYIYQETVPNGMKVSQSWALVSKETDVVTVIQSYNNITKDELYDMIDKFDETGKFGIKVFDKSSNGYEIYVMHHAGNIRI